MGKKDFWNTQPPGDDKQFASYVAHPGLADLLPVLYPGVFPNLAALNKKGTRPRRPGGDPADGHPEGDHPRLPELHRRHPGGHAPPERGGQARRPSPASTGSSAATWPASRTGAASSTTSSPVELRAIAGATYALVDKTYKPDAAASAVTDGLTPADLTAPYLSEFPYLGVPHSGFTTP